MTKNKKGITIVELIVVIAILSILGTIGFISLQGFIKSTRDSVRLSDINSMKKSLEFHYTNSSKYPDPSEMTITNYSGLNIWKQGIYGSSVKRITRILDTVPVDPLYDSNYIYSVTDNNSEYELSGVIEGSSVVSNNRNIGISESFAANNGLTARVIGNYNGLLLRTSSGGTDYVIASPSIISTDKEITDFITLIQTNKLVYNNKSNLYKTFGDNINETFNIDSNKVLLYSGKMEDLESQANQLILLENLQSVYSGSTLDSDDDILNTLVSLSIDRLNPTSVSKTVACNIVTFNLRYPNDCKVNNALEEITETFTPNLTITQTSGSPVKIGTGEYNIDYTINVENTGNSSGTYTLNTSILLTSGVISSIGSITFTDDDTDISPILSPGFNGSSNTEIINSETIAPSSTDTYTYTVTYTIATTTLDSATICDGSANPGKIFSIITNASLDTGVSGNSCSNLTIPEENIITPPTVTSTVNLPGLGDISSAIVDSNGDLWFGTDDGLAVYDGNSWLYYDESDGLIDENVLFVTEAASNIFWIGTHNKGISIYNASTDSWTDIDKQNSGLLHNNIISLYVDSGGTLWIGNRQGVNSYTTGTWEDYGTAEGLSHKHVSAFFEDSNNYIWFGTTSGLDKYNLNNGSVTTYTSSNTGGGMSNSDAIHMVEDSNNNIWVGTDGGGLSKYEPSTSTWSKFTSSNTSSALVSDSIKYLFIDSQNNLWVGTNGLGVSRFNLTTNQWVDTFSTSNGLSGNTIYSIYEDSINDIVIINDGAIDKITP